MTEVVGAVSLPALHVDGCAIGLWRLDLAPPPGSLEWLASTLTEDERARASRYRRAEDRDRFVAARGMVRAILGDRIGRRPGEVSFLTAPYGRPSLAASPESRGIDFSLSHSGDVGLLALAQGTRVGVDLERIHTGMPLEGLIRSALSPREQEAFLALAPDARPRTFFAMWTSKEAVVKALGWGLSYPLAQVEVALTGAAPALLSLGGERSAAEGWSLHRPEVSRGYVSGLAVGRLQ
jgi:4'-phosphopantetheinyl transferase